MKVVFFTQDSCKSCEKALPFVEKFARENKFELEIIHVDKLPEEKKKRIGEEIGMLLTPAVCVADDDGIKRCVVGYYFHNYEKALKALVEG